MLSNWGLQICLCPKLNLNSKTRRMLLNEGTVYIWTTEPGAFTNGDILNRSVSVEFSLIETCSFNNEMGVSKRIVFTLLYSKNEILVPLTAQPLKGKIKTKQKQTKKPKKQSRSYWIRISIKIFKVIFYYGADFFIISLSFRFTSPMLPQAINILTQLN